MYTVLLWIVAKHWIPNLGVDWVQPSALPFTNSVTLSVNKGRHNN